MKFFVKILFFICLFEVSTVFFQTKTRGGESIEKEIILSSDHFFNSQSERKEFNHFEHYFERFLRYWHIKGASVAVSKDGQLIYAKGFGNANDDIPQAVEPYHLFRIASMSKLITAVAVMHLVEQNELSLDQKVFGKDGIVNDPRFLNYKDKRVESITVKNLLNHSGGWTTRWGDPMFIQTSMGRYHGYELPLSEDDIIEIMLSNRLHFKPGGASYYSNFGFMLLGKVIEEVTGMSYEAYVQRTILMPLGIFDMQLAANSSEQKAPLEVSYYEQDDALRIRPFDGGEGLVSKSDGGNNYEVLGAAGAWIASATDILKLLNAIDGFDMPRDILSKESIEIMTRNEGNGFSPLGWRKTSRYGNWIRTGSFAGSSTVLKRSANGINYVILCNTSTWVGPDLPFKLSSFADRELKRMKKFPRKHLRDSENVSFLN